MENPNTVNFKIYFSQTQYIIMTLFFLKTCIKYFINYTFEKKPILKRYSLDIFNIL